MLPHTRYSDTTGRECSNMVRLACSKLRTMRSVDDIVLNLSLRKLSKHEHSIERYCIELLDPKQKT